MNEKPAECRFPRNEVDRARDEQADLFAGSDA